MGRAAGRQEKNSRQSAKCAKKNIIKSSLLGVPCDFARDFTGNLNQEQRERMEGIINGKF
jgi:hypothetical protein